MKMSSKIIIIFLISLSLLNGCKPKDTEQKQTLSVTIEPQKYFLSSLVGDHYNVNCIVPSGSNPESADFTPSQMMALDRSAAYFKIGYLGIENTLIDKISKSNPSLFVVDCSQGIQIIDGCDHSHDSHEHNNTVHYGHAGGDPHTWSSVKSAKIIVDNMYNALLELDKNNEIYYQDSYNELINKINQTDSLIKSYLSKSPSKAFIIYHPALSYFAEEYGLTQYSIEHEGKNPSPSQLKSLIDKAKSENVKVVFIQQEYDIKNAETVAEAINGKIVPLNLLSYHWDEEMIKIAKALAQE